MKKFIWPFLFSFFAGAHAYALADIEITGEADLNASLYNLPTSLKGESAFSVPTLLLNFNVPLKDGNFLYTSFEGAERRDEQSKPFTVQTREAYLNLVSIFSGTQGLRLGLIPQNWLEAQYEDWDYRFLGPTGWEITEKWKYLFYSDLGGSFSSNLVAEWGDWALSVVNGEGRDTEVPEQHKEAALYFHLTPWTPFSVSLGYLRGAYDKYDNDVNLRERIQVLLTYRTEDDHWKFGLEFLDAHDPADAITDLKMADGVDVTSLTGQVVHGRGGSLYTIVRTGPKAELMLRWDTLNPVVGESGKNLNTYLGALAYQVTEDVKAAFEADYTQYGSQFGNGIRDSSKIEIAAQVLF